MGSNENMDVAAINDVNVCNENESSATMKKLEDILECPVCLEVPTSPPIFRCDNGHILCKDCRKNVTHCPNCRIVLGNKRCLTSEKIVRAFSLKVNR